MKSSVAAAVLAVLCLTRCTQGFLVAPPHASTGASSFNGRALSVRAGCRPATVAVQMNLADRFMRVAKANLNSLLAKVEDPEKVLEQAVDDMQRDLVKVRQSYAEVSATQKRMERQRAEANRLADEWYKRAQLALEKGDEGLAREALSRRQTQVDIMDTILAQMNTQAQALDQMRGGMQALEAKITEAKGKKDALIARARSAKTTQSVNDMLGNVTGSSGMEAFERMQQKVEALESAAEVSAQLTGTASGSLESQFKALEGDSSVDKELAEVSAQLTGTASGLLESQFKALEGDSSVDRELAALKAALPGSSSPASRALPSSPRLDEELEQLKRELGQ